MSVPSTTTPDAPIRIGSRGSALALVQAEWTRDHLTEAGLAVEIVIIRTAGDDRAPDTAWGEGAFVTAIETALVDGRIDVAVHSAKDVPTSVDPRLAIAAWTTREDPRDALVCRVRGTSLATLPDGARVGTDSPRRGAMLRSVRPDLLIHPLSGNVDTRLRKLDAGESDALVLAVAGLTRLGRRDRIDQILPISLAVPAPGQGALALQCRAGDRWTIEALARLDDPATRAAVEAERAFLAATGGGCRSPIGAVGTVADGTLTLHVAAERLVELPGHDRRRAGVVRLEASGRSDDGIAIATDLAARVVRLRGRARILVTRPDADAAPLADALGSRGLEAVVIPTIDVRDEPPARLVDALVALDGGRVVATSPNGVRTALVAATAAGIAPTDLGWAVTGSASAAPLRARGIEPWLPPRPDAGSIAESLPIAPGERILLVRGDLADPTLARALAARGARVAEAIGYRTVEGPEASREAICDALGEPIDAIVAASGSAIRGLLALVPADAHERLRSIPFVCIGRTTAGVARDLGLATVSDASDPTPDSLADAVVRVLVEALPGAQADDEPGSTRSLVSSTIPGEIR